MAQQEAWWPCWGQFKHMALCPATLSAQPGWEGQGGSHTPTRRVPTQQGARQLAGQAWRGGRPRAARGLGCGLRAESGRLVSADLSSPTNVVLLGTPLPPGPRRACSGCSSRALPARQAGRHAQGPAVRVTAGRALGLHEPAGPGPSPGPSLPLPWPNARLHPGLRLGPLRSIPSFSRCLGLWDLPDEWRPQFKHTPTGQSPWASTHRRRKDRDR